MTRSSTSKLFKPYEEPEQEFRSSRRHFKTLSLDELRSPDFNLFYGQEYSEEEKADLHNNAFSGRNRKDAIEHIEYYLKIIDPIKLPNANHDKLRVVIFPISLAGCARRWFDKTKESITCWVDLTANFFGNYYPPSRIEGNNTPVIKWDPANPRFEGWLATKFVKYKMIHIFTKGALWDYWKMGGDEIKASDNEYFDLKEKFARAYHIGNSLHYQDLEWYEALKVSELKDEALRNDESIVLMNQAMIVGKDGKKSHEIYYHNYNEGEYKTKLIKKDMSYVVSKLARGGCAYQNSLVDGTKDEMVTRTSEEAEESILKGLHCKTKVLPGRQHGLLFNFIVSVVPLLSIRRY
ncbi:hypothetical protein Tco_0548893 [Tanacetum coccineum]